MNKKFLVLTSILTILSTNLFAKTIKTLNVGACTTQECEFSITEKLKHNDIKYKTRNTKKFKVIYIKDKKYFKKTKKIYPKSYYYNLPVTEEMIKEQKKVTLDEKLDMLLNKSDVLIEKLDTKIEYFDNTEFKPEKLKKIKEEFEKIQKK